MDLFQGIQYCTGYQARFENALRQGELETAFQVIESMPYAQEGNRKQELQRNAVLALGYRELARTVFTALQKPTPGGREGERAAKSTSPLSLAAKLNKLFEYEEINPSLGELSEQISRLKDYTQLGTPDEIRDAQAEMEELEREIEELRSIPSV